MPVKAANPIPPDTTIDDIVEDIVERLPFGEEMAAAAKPAIVASLCDALAVRELHLVRLTDARAPIQHAVTTMTPAGPVSLGGADHNGLGIKLIVETTLTGHATALMLKYPEAGELGAWLVGRAVKAAAALRSKRPTIATRWKGATNEVPVLRPEELQQQPDAAEPDGGQAGGKSVAVR